jgi:hypothetical protein
MGGRLAESPAMIDKLPQRGMHMPTEAQTLTGGTHGAGDDEFEALYAVLSSSARGRAFLAEHARRSRQADTGTLLAALARIEALLAEQRAAASSPPSSPPPAPSSPPTALAAVAAQAIAAARDEMVDVKVVKAGAMPPPAPFAGDDFASASSCESESGAATAPQTGAAAADDALATLLALSEDERLALFS